MSRSRRAGWILGAMVVVVAAAFLWQRTITGRSVPTHEGRTLGQWLHDYYRSSSPAAFETNYLALKALRAHSIPVLAELSVHTVRPTRWAQFLKEMRARMKLPGEGISYETLQRFSRFALQTWDPSAKELLPAAERLFDGALLDGKQRGAIAMLQFAVRDREECVPLLIRAYRKESVDLGEVASEISRELFKAHPPAELCEPLIEHLRRGAPDYGSLDDSYLFLGEFGPAAISASAFIRERFERATNYVKAALGGALVRIDPTATNVLETLASWALDPNHELRSAAITQLIYAGPAMAPVAERIWASLDDAVEPHRLEDALVRIFPEGRPGEHGALREKLLARFHRQLSDEARNSPLDGRLNPAWRILRLNPEDPRAWEVFRASLLQPIDSDSFRANLGVVTIAMEYLLSIPISTEEKKKLLHEALTFYSGARAPRFLLQENAMKHLIQLDPAERPSDLMQLIELYLE